MSKQAKICANESSNISSSITSRTKDNTMSLRIPILAFTAITTLALVTTSASAVSIGHPLVDGGTDTLGGAGFIMINDPVSLGAAGDVTEFSFYSKISGTTITPLIFDNTDTVIGVGTTRTTTTAAGTETFDFDLVSGSAAIGPGKFFGWQPAGTNISPVAFNTGAAGHVRYFTGPANAALTDTVTGGSTLPRIYSLQFDTNATPVTAATIGPGAGITDATTQDTPGSDTIVVDTTVTKVLAAGDYQVDDWTFNVLDHTEGGTITPMLLAGSPSSYTTLWLGSPFDPTSNGIQTESESGGFTLAADTDVYAAYFTTGGGGGIIALDSDNSGSGFSVSDVRNSPFATPTVGGTVDGFNFPGLVRTYAFEINVAAAPTATAPEPSAVVLAALGFAGLAVSRRRRR